MSTGAAQHKAPGSRGHKRTVVDVFDAKTRSLIMSRVRSRGNLSTEQRLASILRRDKLCGWRRGYPLPGKPDFIFPGSRVALFVDGCFWHGCPVHGEIPASNREYWQKKIDANMRRDRRTARRLRSLGWHVFRIWEHELRAHGLGSLNRKLGRIRKMLEP